MTADAGPGLPDSVIAGMGAKNLSTGQATLVITVDTTGVPRVALLSNAELYVADRTHLHIAMWSGSRSEQNVRRTGDLLLFRVDAGVPRSIRLRCDAPRPLLKMQGRSLSCFVAEITSVNEDTVDYARLVSTYEFELNDPVTILPTWERIQNALSSASAARTGPSA